MLWPGKRKKKSDATNQVMTGSKHRPISDHYSSEPSVSRSSTSTGSLHFEQIPEYGPTVEGRIKVAEGTGRLVLSDMHLSEFPVHACSNIELQDIVFIDLDDNDLTTLPDDFSSFDCLISFIASSNRFRKVPTCICNLDQLTYVDFSHNEISVLPDGLFDLPLTALLCSGNKITSIPEGIRRLAPTLAYLDFSSNQLHRLQSQLKHLKALRVLKISKNKIEDFPSEMCSLELRTLDLAQNNMSFLPLDFVKMTNLRNLQLDCNPMRSPPMEIVNRGIVHIFKWIDGRTSGSSFGSRGSQDGLSHEHHTLMSIVAEKHAPHNDPRAARNNSAPAKPYHHDIKSENGHLNHRPKELVETKAIHTVHAKPHNVQIVHNKISSVPSQLPHVHAGKENSSTPDEQNNNSNHGTVKANMTNISSPGMTKKPISKVAPMVKQPVRPTAVINGNTQSRISTVRRPNTMPTTVSTKKEMSMKVDPVSRTKFASAATRRSEEPPSVKNVSKPVTSSISNLSKTGQRSPTINDVESARKLMREKLGPTFALSKGDISFSVQLSDGLELCKFINKLQPNAISIVSPAEASVASTRSKLNVDKFLQYCKKIGVPENTLCSQIDIISKRNPQKVARTVLSVAKLQNHQSSTVNSIQC
ncbi:unnamed protein product [Caenorhabditis sp. 36 PRJEB53466]|nr:unnamed protein product [Caenorhabditis sp. 36 PRJEB53466]